MAKHRGRRVTGVSTANPRRIMKKVARARAHPSLYYSDGLKDESMKKQDYVLHLYYLVLYCNSQKEKTIATLEQRPNSNFIICNANNYASKTKLSPGPPLKARS